MTTAAGIGLYYIISRWSEIVASSVAIPACLFALSQLPSNGGILLTTSPHLLLITTPSRKCISCAPALYICAHIHAGARMAEHVCVLLACMTVTSACITVCAVHI